MLYGNHGGMSWGVQAVPLVLSGPGVRAGVHSQAPARLVDVAPTVMRLLGLTLASQDGLILADALQSPTSAEVHNQVKIGKQLRAYQDALMQAADAQVREDRKSKIALRPRVPATP